MQSDSQLLAPQNRHVEILSTHSSPRIGYFVAEESARHSSAHPAIYLDTTIVSYLTTGLSHRLPIAKHQRITRIWWHEYRHLHALWSSPVMLDEAAQGNAAAAAARLEAAAEIEAEGFRCPEICTPEELMRTYAHAKSTHR